jgi:hypothetical protein
MISQTRLQPSPGAPNEHNGPSITLFWAQRVIDTTDEPEAAPGFSLDVAL